MKELLNMTIEESSELIQACCKYKRWIKGDYTLRDDNGSIVENLKEEIVDVYNMLLQLRDKMFIDDKEFYTLLGIKMFRTEELKNNKK